MIFFTGLGIAFTVIYYVLVYLACSYSLYVIAKRCNVENASFAWVPILQYYVIGSICEEYELFGVRIKKLEWALCGLALVQMFAGLTDVFAASVISIAISILIAFVMHKFFYLFVPQRATIYAILSALDPLPLAIILFITKDAPIQMSAGAYKYPFANKLK